MKLKDIRGNWSSFLIVGGFIAVAIVMLLRQVVGHRHANVMSTVVDTGLIWAGLANLINGPPPVRPTVLRLAAVLAVISDAVLLALLAVHRGGTVLTTFVAASLGWSVLFLVVRKVQAIRQSRAGAVVPAESP